ncbi:MAG: hypothetical protein K2W86_16265 [Sphingomonas sp.]|uniref:hypothetical protein n=1 Tax=Sphingomonas sp. TaxID=28214 RepID=UPI0035A8374C|nr:hypothetical protein [Sphingomonas sp.]
MSKGAENQAHTDWLDAIVRHVAARHPYGGNSLCRALREAAELGWQAGHVVTSSPTQPPAGPNA